MHHSYKPFVLHVNMLESILPEEMKWHAVTVSLAEEHSDLKISAFLKLAWSFIFKVRSELKAAMFGITTIHTGNGIVRVMTLSRCQYPNAIIKSLVSWVDEGIYWGAAH